MPGQNSNVVVHVTVPKNKKQECILKMHYFQTLNLHSEMLIKTAGFFTVYTLSFLVILNVFYYKVNYQLLPT